jgi:hypothetical protein
MKPGKTILQCARSLSLSHAKIEQEEEGMVTYLKFSEKVLNLFKAYRYSRRKM